MILFCLPYAGGSEAIYFKWREYLENSVELDAIKLKGRGGRFGENCYKSIDEAVDDIFDSIKNRIEDANYAIFGHSMGSLLAFELYYKIAKEGFRKPKHIFFSAHKAPHLPQGERISSLQDTDFLEKIFAFGGMPVELKENKELLEIFLPIIRSDFKMLEDYEYKSREKKIECDVSVLSGKEDSITFDELLSWGEHTSGDFKLIPFDGGHFYIDSNTEKITDAINATLQHLV